jgi:uncharacterized protein YkwD
MPNIESLHTAAYIILIISCISFLFSGIIISQTYSTTDIENYILQYINQERSNRGLPELQTDSKLNTIAKEWSTHIAQTGNLEHGDFQARLTTIGYQTNNCGEIIQTQTHTPLFPFEPEMYYNPASATAKQFIIGWLNSPQHKEIMLTDQTGCIGIGISKLSALTYYGVVDFNFN